MKLFYRLKPPFGVAEKRAKVLEKIEACAKSHASSRPGPYACGNAMGSIGTAEATRAVAMIMSGRNCRRHEAARPVRALALNIVLTMFVFCSIL